MKKILLLLLLFSLCFINIFGQQKKETNLQKNQPQNFFENLPKNLSDDSLTAYILKNKHKIQSITPDKFINSFLDNLNPDKVYTIDSIPEIAQVFINGLEFQNKNILCKIDNFKITNIRKDSLYTFDVRRMNDSTGKWEYINGKRTYQRPYARITQEHHNLAQHFFLFKINTLEAVRYRSSAYSPILDVFNTEDSIGIIVKPRVMIDGRLQAKSFDYDKINLEKIEKVDVFGNDDAVAYFGQKGKAGLISYITKGSQFNFDWALANIHVVGEIQDSKGKWKQIVDTLFTNLDQFKEYRKKCLNANGAIYIINGKAETELSNRKTIDMDAITNFKVVSSTKIKRMPMSVSDKLISLRTEMTTADNDTIYIETNRAIWAKSGTSNFSKIVSELKRLRNTDPEPVPIYIVDNQEITSEKLKEFKNKELEFVESLEGCDAISRYGKRAEYGVVIYRKKKLE
ncbi:hypothetical protein LV89_04375 [Arcicella aurantiaca]|uniref:TonB-dependent receptor plug domain-containing protein n=1 Tax=Arcicella aurantiaca TaxID=591202 RepID=A0A316E3J3_9BACT|nr:hypothetical protein [Arcicella aurantiaca]PWK17460.1 hypothetical protein LV89_04375 [Arcicella aurantiaca]